MIDAINNRKEYKELRRDLRNNTTAAEKALWKFLRKRQLLGRKFRRQHSIGPYIVDFYCESDDVAVELDGEVHRNDIAYEHDQYRDRYLRALGVRVLRFENILVFQDLDYVLKQIKEVIDQPPLPP